MNLNIDAIKKRTYDAIVIGSGMAGGWAAKELTEKGLKTLVLERGRKVDHIVDYPTAMQEQWEKEHRGMQTNALRADSPIQAKCYAFNESSEQFFVKDKEHPYIQDKPFDWIRGYHVGGKSIMWARQCYRWSDLDFEANAKDGHGVDWPIRYKDIAPWYSYVEKFAGISGNKDGLPQVPDGEFLPPMELNAVEKHWKGVIEKTYAGRNLIIGRSANHTAAVGGRGPCQYRNRCHLGCPFSGYFSSNSATLPAAAATGKMTLRPDSIAHSIIFDEKKNRATGVRVIDAHTKEMTEYYAKIIFVNAATINSTMLLMNSTSPTRFKNGLSNSDALGHYIMDHNYRGRVSAEFEGFEDSYFMGRRPNGFYVPRFRNYGADKQKDFVRGYALSGDAGRASWSRGTGGNDFGATFKESLSEPGKWNIYTQGQGESLPMYENHIALDHKNLDQWGMPTIRFNIGWTANEDAMTKDVMNTIAEMMDVAGFKNIRPSDSHQAPGLGIHEMGGARMGHDPKTSVVNSNSQLHEVKNVFVTDGSSFASQGTQIPAVTFMALTARAADFAVKELKKRNL
ncbi:MAG: hypothetical protein RLZZ292_3123 [Bacteroidota bacterium]|jgi:choline dehydrogenase-like flavoprotein